MKTAIVKIGLCLIATSCFAFNTVTINAVKIPTINCNTKTINAGKSTELKVTNTSKKVTWTSSKSKVVKIVKVSGKNSCKVKIKGLKKGTATVTAKVGTKKLKCKVTVNNVSSKYYITETGSKYHVSSCRTLNKSKIPVTLSSAKANGYTPCGICLK